MGLFRNQVMTFLIFMIVFLGIRVVLMGKIQIVLGDPSEMSQQEVLSKMSDSYGAGPSQAAGASSGSGSGAGSGAAATGPSDRGSSSSSSSSSSAAATAGVVDPKEKAKQAALAKVDALLGVDPTASASAASEGGTSSTREGRRGGSGKRGSRGGGGDSDKDVRLPKDWRRYLRPEIDIVMNQDELTKISGSGEVEYKANKYGMPYVDLKVRSHSGFRRVQVRHTLLLSSHLSHFSLHSL